MSESDDPCRICGVSAHGMHFGVLACRGCAAFYRRTVAEGRKYTCRRGDSKCDTTKTVRSICRACRFQRCLELGMTSENIQLNRDRLSNGSKSNGGAENEVSSTTADQQPQTSATAEFHQAVAQHSCQRSHNVRQILTTGIPVELPSNSLLERVSNSLVTFRACQSSNPTKIEFVDLQTGQIAWEAHMHRVAGWFASFPEFSQLSSDDKMIIFKHRWRPWRVVERLHLTLKMYGGERMVDEMLLVVTDEYVVSLKELVVDMSAVSDYSAEYLKKSISDPMNAVFFDDIVKPVLEMNLDEAEFMYFICMTGFYVEGLELSKEAHQVAIDIRDRASSDLHEYYLRIERKNYVDRLLKINRLLETAENIQVKRSKLMELAKIFDVIKTDFCEDCCIIKL